MSLILQPVRVATGSDEEGMLVFAGDRLVAVLVRLTDQHAETGLAGHWFLETGFGVLDRPHEATFPDLEAAKGWVHARLRDGRGGAGGA
ncbi:hypothetical protein [Salinarimonas soli]|uniref:Uncharacterized protein n=1 Tax=Salinarimonas soli TaxID=1638099 RepID=A0A5B2VAQ6_9HYPH|nr:hypothetical protein [Salinarimonas soli]KAA2236613.1 hypothetical protein F0L46_14180 [Salinarimonas soli]